MTAQWYWLVGEHEYGPFTSEQLQNLARGGQLTKDHFVRPQSSATWLSATDIPGLFPAEESRPDGTRARRAEMPRPAARPPAAASPASAPAAGARSAAAPPTSAPKKKPVSSKPVATPPPAPTGAGAGRAPAPVPRAAPAPVESFPSMAPPIASVVGSTAGHHARHGLSAGQAKRSQQQMYLVVGVLGLLVLVAGAGLAFVLLRKHDQPSVAAAAKKPAAEEKKTDNPEKPPEPENVESDPKVKPSASKTDADSAETKTASALLGNASLASVSTWVEAPKKVFLPGKFAVEVPRVRKGTSGKLPVVMAELQVSNISTNNDLDFSGWITTSGDKTTAEMFDDAGKRLPGIDDAQPVAQTLAPGESVKQALQFAWPKSEFKKLRLVLPGAALGRTTPLGFEISAAIVANVPEPSARPAGAASGKAPKPTAAASDENGMGADLKRQIQDAKAPPDPPPMDEQPKSEKPTAMPQDDEEKPRNLKLEIEGEEPPP
jgi:hypothetical protein